MLICQTSFAILKKSFYTNSSWFLLKFTQFSSRKLICYFIDVFIYRVAMVMMSNKYTEFVREI